MIEFGCPADPNYKFSFVPIITGALGTLPKDLYENIRQLDFNKKESNDIIKSIQQRAIIGMIKICKTFMNFKK